MRPGIHFPGLLRFGLLAEPLPAAFCCLRFLWEEFTALLDAEVEHTLLCELDPDPPMVIPLEDEEDE